ncbi:MAG: hypothetical protein HY711_02315, partial [Candidatus Melainabacteria bacterium]|nr:hypothetical protein [Candidatus Melainabacteria bacterium]
SWGVGGETKTQNFTVGRVKMGPIEHSDFPVSVPESQMMGKPLLGQEFYKGWQYTIDYDNKVIKFLRR